MNEMSWEGVDEHCRIGAGYLSGFEPLAYAAPWIRHHHTLWNVYDKLGTDTSVRRAANLLFLADRVDAMVSSHSPDQPFRSANVVKAQVRLLRGSYFAPELVDAFMDLADRPSIWVGFESRAVDAFARSMVVSGSAVGGSGGEERVLAEILGRIVDAKSPFTNRHSAGVARVAVALARACGCAPENAVGVEMAGQLHDLGMLRISDELFEKQGPLSAEESNTMRRHSFDTYRILDGIPGFDNVTRWGAFHHERMNGTGYPFHVCEGDLDVESRVIAVADVFQALVQDRPYRSALSDERIGVVFEDLAATRSLDRDVVAEVLHDVSTYRRLAIGEAA